MPLTRINGLAKLTKLLKAVCDVIAVFGPTIRKFVPAESLDDYDQALTTITAACDVIRQIDYADGLSGTTPPWGA